MHRFHQCSSYYIKVYSRCIYGWDGGGPGADPGGVDRVASHPASPVLLCNVA